MNTIQHIVKALGRRLARCLWLLVLLCFYACEKDIDIAIKPAVTQLVVEAYINNEIPQYNYVILSRSQNYFAPDFRSIPVSDARVTITEGQQNSDGSYTWNPATTTILEEADEGSAPSAFTRGIYFDKKLISDTAHALKGVIGKSYLLQIEAEGNQYSAVATLVVPVIVDSLTQGYPFVNDIGDSLFRITNHYKDPDTLGNVQFYMWRWSTVKNNFGWGGLTRSRTLGIDDYTNGEYIQLTHPQGFSKTDTVNYFMASVTRDVFKFWDSFNKARENVGPFSTPVNLVTNISGTNVTGCFSGFAISSKTIVIR
ncbi:MAG TPA: DUF4249 family protein [Ferruginibacter sp.]|nr:DUF4249 family protein [Ferruginibacter sp.]HMP21626.1 DUF4249 family protein [Ferruginibacter sp.]